MREEEEEIERGGEVTEILRDEGWKVITKQSEKNNENHREQ